MDGTSSNMMWIVVVVAIIALIFAAFKYIFPNIGKQVGGIMTKMLDNTTRTVGITGGGDESAKQSSATNK